MKATIKQHVATITTATGDSWQIYFTMAVDKIKQAIEKEISSGQKMTYTIN